MFTTTSNSHIVPAIPSPVAINPGNKGPPWRSVVHWNPGPPRTPIGPVGKPVERGIQGGTLFVKHHWHVSL